MQSLGIGLRKPIPIMRCRHEKIRQQSGCDPAPPKDARQRHGASPPVVDDLRVRAVPHVMLTKTLRSSLLVRSSQLSAIGHWGIKKQVLNWQIWPYLYSSFLSPDNLSCCCRFFLRRALCTKLNQFNFVTIGIFDKGNYSATMFHRSWFATNFTALSFDAIASAVNIVYA